MNRNATKESYRPKELPYSPEVLKRIWKQSEIGFPEIGKTQTENAKTPARFSTHAYHSENIFLSEKGEFANYPVQFGFNGQISESGDHLVSEFGDRQFFVLKDGEGTLRAYYNSCIHRGTRLLSEAKNKPVKKIVCPYHSWTYDLDGKLLTADCPTQETALKEISVKNIAGTLFAEFQEGALNRLNPVLEELQNFELDSYVPFIVEKSVGDYNWKVGIEIFIESYHISTVHKNSVARVIAKNASIFDPIAEHGRILIPNRSFQHVPSPTRKDLIISYFLFPFTILILFRDHFGVVFFHPISSEKTLCTKAILIPEKPKAPRAIRFWENNAAFFLKTISEDLSLAPEIQLGLKQREFIYPSAFEPGILHFHNSISALWQ
ncbi:Rieske 2Fe-2S domain-containing protein [Leptospira sp. FAT2]|uniref:aromatic ring-hydroxylating oxygenase subunit alpha n=1 Tax=Leptospira sanjuanensis TaxID=2879643 RepID=UPI001EE84E09|nr:SRPBCC family protein [Leptospira sanjuanensis]MCG6193996.1 Rieske 2Fe-2S domain-containing protein [Leptospira sanjuanensis]